METLDYEQLSWDECLSLAKQGDLEAMCQLGYSLDLYEWNFSQSDFDTAVYYAKKALEKNYPKAYYVFVFLGHCRIISRTILSWILLNILRKAPN